MKHDRLLGTLIGFLTLAGLATGCVWMFQNWRTHHEQATDSRTETEPPTDTRPVAAPPRPEPAPSWFGCRKE